MDNFWFLAILMISVVTFLLHFLNNITQKEKGGEGGRGEGLFYNFFHSCVLVYNTSTSFH